LQVGGEFFFRPVEAFLARVAGRYEAAAISGFAVQSVPGVSSGHAAQSNNTNPNVL
jgi:hypothetical protein